MLAVTVNGVPVVNVTALPEYAVAYSLAPYCKPENVPVTVEPEMGVCVVPRPGEPTVVICSVPPRWAVPPVRPNVPFVASTVAPKVPVDPLVNKLPPVNGR